MRIDTLTYNNVQMQGPKRRAWLREHSPQHLEQCAALMRHALQKRPESASHSTLVLGAGACTEVPLAELARDGITHAAVTQTVVGGAAVVNTGVVGGNLTVSGGQ